MFRSVTGIRMMSSSPEKHLDIVIVGGSLAGLFAGTSLRRLGHNVVILERSPTPLLHDQGAGIVAGNETRAFLARHDRTRREYAVTSRLRLHLDQHGGIIQKENSVQQMTSWDLVYHLLRANFDAVGSDYLNGAEPPKPNSNEGIGKYEFGRKVEAVEEAENNKVSISWSNTRQDQTSPSEGTVQADLLLAADGPSSKIRSLLPSISNISPLPPRTYAGYVAFRGTVPESQLPPPESCSPSSNRSPTSAFLEQFTFFHGPSTQILAYTIPGPPGSLNPNTRLINWVWYVNYPWPDPSTPSSAFNSLMTDTTTHQTHRYTLPPTAKLPPEIWSSIRQRARDILPPQFSFLVQHTQHPFVQAITDVPPPSSSSSPGPTSRYLNDRIILIGDALSQFRPHTAASTSQAALHALLLEQVVVGRMTWDDYDEYVMQFAREVQRSGVSMGEQSQFGVHPLQQE